MSPDEIETGKLEVRPRSKETEEYIRKLMQNDGYYDAIAEYLAGKNILALEQRHNLSKGKTITILVGIRRYTLKILYYSRPYLTGIDRYGRVWTFDLTRVTAIMQPASEILERAQQGSQTI